MQSTAPPPAPRSLGGWLRLSVPAIDSLRGYSVSKARADLFAGLSVAAVAVPQAMAYALVAGLPAQYGLYTAIVMTAVGALLDSSKQLINGPTNAVAIAVLSAIGSQPDLDSRVAAAITLAFLVGALQIGFSLLRLGDLTRYISHSVIVGFTAGASLLLVIDQTKNLFGFAPQGGPHDHFLSRFWLTITEGGAVHAPTLAIGAASVALVLALRWAKKALGWTVFPELLVVVAVMAAATSILGLEGRGVRVIGPIPSSLPSPSLPNLDAERVRDLASSALAIALLGLLEAIAMAKSIAAITKQKLDLNQQCLSEGMANLVGSFYSCMPGSGSLTRSALNQQAGAKTQWSGVVAASAVALTMVAFAPYARFIPRAALAAILIVTAARMIDPRELRHHVRASRFDAALVIATAIAALAISVEFCLLVGVFLSFMLAVPRAGNMILTEFVVTPGGGARERLEEDAADDHLLIFGLEGEMFFGSSASLERHFEHIEGRIGPDTRVLVLRLKRARNPDAVGMRALEGHLSRMKERGVVVILCGVRRGMARMLERCGLYAVVEAANVFLEQPVRQTSTQLAIAHALSLLKTTPELGGIVPSTPFTRSAS